MRRVNFSKERDVFPTVPKSATYEGSVIVNSNECNAPSYMYGVKEVTDSAEQVFAPRGRSC